jgi:tRNA A-37 threonylcarbamoyl transferase component Bud32
MESLKLAALARTAGTAERAKQRVREPAVRSAEVTGAVVTAAYDGLQWTYRNGFNAALDRLTAEQWTYPERQGWQQVKKNSAREVWRARIQNRTYYLKYYTRGGWASRLKALLRGSAAQAEWNSGIYALQTGIHAARPAGYCVRLAGPRRDWSLLVTEAIEPAYPLNQFWLNLAADEDPARRAADTQQLIELLAELIAHAHQAGFEHIDMHAANILVQAVGPRKYRALLVDLHSARLGAPIHDGAVVRNLAQLNQWFRKHSSIKDRLRWLRAYVRWRNEYEHSFPHARSLGLGFRELVRALVGAAGRQADAIAAQRDRRIARNGRYFARLKLGGGWRALAFVRCKHPLAESRASGMVLTRDWWKSQLGNPAGWFEGRSAESCKDSHSAQVRRAVLEHPDGNLPVIIKRPLARNWLRRLRQLLPWSRSARGWSVGQALLHRDVPAARPLALLERRIGPLVIDSMLITEAVPGATDLVQYLDRERARCSPREWFMVKRRLARMLARELRRLQECGVLHRDCKAENILVRPLPEPKLYWIDMDGVRVRRGTTCAAAMQRALVRLHVSLLNVPGLTRTDRVRLLREYLARFGARNDVWRELWRSSAVLVARKLAQRARRERWKLEHYRRL